MPSRPANLASPARGKTNGVKTRPRIPTGRSVSLGLAGGGQAWIPHAANAAELVRALAESQHHLDLALRQIVNLDQEVALLTQSLTQERRFSSYDVLTGLPNRRLLLDRFNQAVARASREHKKLALLFLDLDGFKNVNDSLGHESGDELLKQVAGRLSSSLRTSDTACRYGGDEFVILLAEIAGRENAQVAAGKIRACIAKPYLLEGKMVQLTTSIGIAVYPIDGHGYAELMLHSDLSMYFDKARCQTPFRVSLQNAH